MADEQKPQTPPANPLSRYSVEELLDLRKRIDAMLPSRNLRDVNLEKELVLQLDVVKQLQTDTLSDTGIPANQMAQVAGQVANVLSTLGKLQVELYDSERLKKIEQILIDSLNELPEEAQAAFIERYEQMLGGVL